MSPHTLSPPVAVAAPVKSMLRSAYVLPPPKSQRLSATQTPRPKATPCAFPLPAELWAHVLSHLNLRELPVSTLADLMAIGACVSVRSLDLGGREIGPFGAKAVLDRLRARACPELTEVSDARVVGGVVVCIRQQYYEYNCGGGAAGAGASPDGEIAGGSLAGPRVSHPTGLLIMRGIGH
jgi:hypothetical protein